MKKTNIPHAKREKAQSLVEIAISLVIILMLLSGAVDFGIALYSYVSIRDAAQEGALFASINPEATTDIEARVRSSSSSPVDLTSPNVIVTVNADSPACEGYGAVVQVEVDYDYQLIMPLLPDILGVTEIPLTASVANAILQPTCLEP